MIIFRQIFHFSNTIEFIFAQTGEYQKLIEKTEEAYDKYGFMISDDSVFKHHHYEEMERFMKKFNKTYANITHMYSIGKTVEGREMWVFVVSSTPFKHTPGKY